MTRLTILTAALIAAALALRARQHAPRAAPRLTAADSQRVLQAYDAEVASTNGAYDPPPWIRALHLSRLRAAAERQIGTDSTPPATPPSVIDSIVDAGSSGTYIRAILTRDGAFARWPDRTAPIAVWIDAHPAVDGFDPAFVSPVRAAFLRWNDADAGVTYTIVDDSTVADVHVTWSATLLIQRELGSTFRLTDGAGRITIAHVVLLSTPGIEAVQNAALHEAGHALGLDHSPNPADIMSAASNGRQFRLSDADLRTLRLLYTLPF